MHFGYVIVNVNYGIIGNMAVCPIVHDSEAEVEKKPQSLPICNKNVRQALSPYAVIKVCKRKQTKLVYDKNVANQVVCVSVASPSASI